MIERFAKMAVGGQWPGNSWVPAALTPRRLAGPLGVDVASEVRLSADTIRSHVKHRHATPEFYGTAPEHLVEKGELIERDDGRLLLHATLKVVRRQNGDEVYLLSLRRTNARQIARLRDEGKVLTGK